MEETQKAIADKNAKNAATKAKKRHITTFEEVVEPTQKKKRTMKDKDLALVQKLRSFAKILARALIMCSEEADALE